MATAPFGVNVAGYVASEKGVGEGARATIRALAAAAVPYVVNAFTDPGSANREAGDLLSSDNPYRFNVIHVNPDGLDAFRRRHGRAWLRGRDNIGFWAWELSAFPSSWQDAFDLFQEIWVPSTFTLDAVSRMAPVPVVRMPHPMAEPAPADVSIRARLGIAPDTCLFTFVFDFHSTLGRKNPLGVVAAFRRAFGGGDRAVLVLKSVHAASDAAGHAAIRAAAGDPRVHVVDGVWTRGEVQALLAQCDCYVSLHRAEGFGLTIAEAMSLGKPVIVTGYSGNMDFTTADNSLLVRYRLEEIGDEHGQYAKAGVWAEPDVDHAAALMRQIYEDRATGQRIGQAARREVRQAFSPGTVGELMRRRLTYLMERPSGGGPVPVYDRVLDHVRAVVNAVVPEGAKVLVVSKGDDELLALGSRPAEHFPQATDGTYAGHHPVDSVSAVGLLEHARDRGGRFLVIPGTATWWLEHYTAFRAHLDARYRRAWSDADCVVYELAPRGERSVLELDARLRAGEATLAALASDLERMTPAFTARPGVPRGVFDADDPDRAMGYDARASAGPVPSFVDVFRGTETDIADRQRAYLPLLAGCAELVDLACGRGELLGLLAGTGIRARGVDLDGALVARCRARGLDVIHGDALAFVRGLGARSVDAIFSAQFIEHLEPSALEELLGVARDRLRPGGLFIAETVNPECMLAWRAFYVDPTHQRPIYPQVLLYLCRQAGFPAARIFYPQHGGFTQRPYAIAGDYAVVAEA